MALWIGLLLVWFAVALVGGLVLGRILRGLDRPLRVTPPGIVAKGRSAGRVAPTAQRRPTPAA